MKKRFLCGALLVCLLLLAAVSCAETNVYGKTLLTVRVRKDASVSSDIMDNVTSSACVYILETRVSGAYTFGRVNYRDYHGQIATGWVCLKEGGSSYVQVMTDEEAKSFFAVSGGELPPDHAGTFKVAGDVSSASSSASSASGGASDVARLQTRLKALGYYSGQITGNIGTKTEAAIRAFQKAKGLPVTGKADAATLAAAEGGKASAPATAAPTAKATAAPATPAPQTSSARSDSFSDVKALQEYLKKKGYYYGEITGNIGTKTDAAIRAFQKAKGLPVTGKADAATLEAAGLTDEAPSATAAPSAGTSDSVKTLQEQLKTLGYYGGEITGQAGNKTVDAIKRFQKANGLTATGEADSATLKAAKDAVENKNAGGSADTVKKIQENLKTLGYYTAEITGHAGNKTVDAIKRFQKANGLTATGKADSATLKATEAAVKAQQSEKQSVSKGKVYNVDWFKNKTSFYNRIGLKRGNQAKLTDLTTGTSLYIYVQSTGNHADVEPVSAADTKKLCAIYGVTSPEKITYVRRPMLLEVNGYLLVCSIYGVPHGDDTIAGNNYDGQFCLHFSGSKTHGTSRVDADHQNAIEKAANIMKGRGYQIVTAAPSV